MNSKSIISAIGFALIGIGGFFIGVSFVFVKPEANSVATILVASYRIVIGLILTAIGLVLYVKLGKKNGT